MSTEMREDADMRWTEVAEKIGLQREIADRLLECEREWDAGAFAEEIAALADPLTAADTYEKLSKKVAPDLDNIRMLLCELTAAARNWDKYLALGIPERIYTDTMGFFRRVLEEAKAYSGTYTVDRVFWGWRQSSMTIFRLGALEFEMKRAEHTVSIHIPSDADFSPRSVGESLRMEREFCKAYLPEMADARIYCDSWLMSEVLAELLPEDSNIVRFQRRFDMLEQERETDACVRWLFRQTRDTPTEQLREDTSLQRKVKRLMLEGGHIGTGCGVLRDAE